MFTGIVKGLCPITHIQILNNFATLTINLTSELVQNLEIGASVAINGVCLTAVTIDHNLVSFDLIDETLKCTNLKNLSVGNLVNIERSARFGDEIGGHLISGHVVDTVTIQKIDSIQDNLTMQLHCNKKWMKYLFPKGYVALDGISLTIGSVDPNGSFSVHLIPETRRQTTLGFKKEGDLVNLEIDSKTQVYVDTIISSKS